MMRYIIATGKKINIESIETILNESWISIEIGIEWNWFSYWEQKHRYRDGKPS